MRNITECGDQQAAHTKLILTDPAVSPGSASWSRALLDWLLDPGALARGRRGSKRLLRELTAPRKT